MKTKAIAILTLAALAAGVALWLRRAPAPTAAAGAPSAVAEVAPAPPPRFVQAPPSDDGERAATTPYVRPSPPEDPAPPAPPAARPGPVPTTLSVMHSFRVEVCACPDMACANRVGDRYTPQVASSSHTRADDLALDGEKDAVMKCLISLNAPPARGRSRREGGS